MLFLLGALAVQVNVNCNFQMISTTKYIAKACWPFATRRATLAYQANCRNTYNQSRNTNIPTCQIICKRSIASLQEEFYSKFQALDPKRNLNNDVNIRNPRQFDFLNYFSRTCSIYNRDDWPKKKPKRRIPKLILVQNPFTWLMTKVDFCVLRHVWDPEFKEKEFKFGSKQAIARVTEAISGGQFHELNGLLTKAARLSLLRDIERNWSDKQRELLALNRNDIQISSPRKVYFIKIADKKFCDVDMAFLALKWTPINNVDVLLFTEIFARFHREYTPHCIPEWTIAYFKVTRFEVMRR
ncbi:m-AAA protease-interacting protein 1, mitochondrial [Bicyclus anynana]|uniref:M-AAA protease-interacting protein 1, mitochondrial n=1 Tax=Bicyclus anynana TaxID=110368 RepID=A0ABM3LHR5_BICAN|nr:m-AAA protease-interacting protein 1, mitochondrial [Bicyclus anynana]